MSKPKNTEPAAEPGNAFATFLAQLNHGETLNALSEDLTEVVKACRDHGGKGSLTLTLAFKPLNNRSGQIEIIDDIKTKFPKAERGKSLFFGTDHGQLLRRNPNQKEFDFQKDDEPEVSIASSGN